MSSAGFFVWGEIGGVLVQGLGIFANRSQWRASALDEELSGAVVSICCSSFDFFTGRVADYLPLSLFFHCCVQPHFLLVLQPAIPS